MCYLEKSVPGRGNSKYKDSEITAYSLCLRAKKKTNMIRAENRRARGMYKRSQRQKIGLCET